MTKRECEGSPLALIAEGLLAFEDRLWALSVLRVAGLAVLLILLSVSLIATNGYLMSNERFPYPATLILLNMMSNTTFASVLRLGAPSLFPSLTGENRVELSAGLICRRVLPICLASAASLVTSNLAYEYLSIAFMQMLKQTCIIYVYLLSVLVGTEQFSWAQLQVVFMAIAFASISVRGELRYSSVGFGIQVLGTLFESARVALLGALLSGSRWDVLTAILIMSPISVLVLCGLIGVSSFLVVPPTFLAVPPMEKLHEHALLLSASCVLGFSLQVTAATLIKQASAMSYVYVQLIKDIVAVLMSGLLLRDPVTWLQCLGFTLQLFAVFCWSLLKMHPSAFRERGLVEGLVRIASGKPSDAEHVA